MSDKEFALEKRFMYGGLIFDTDIEKHGRCIENPEKECHDCCRKFMNRQCDGAVLIRKAGTKSWVSRGWYKSETRKKMLMK